MEPWSRLPGESEDAYAHFLIYRNLGYSRSLKRAYFRYLQMYDEYTGDIKRLVIPATWRRQCMDHFWTQRATSWDIQNLHTYGSRLAVLYTQAVTKMAEKCVRVSRSKNPGDKEWPDLLDTVQTVREYLTPDVVKGIADRTKSAGPASLPVHAEVIPDDGVS